MEDWQCKWDCGSQVYDVTCLGEECRLTCLSSILHRVAMAGWLSEESIPGSFPLPHP